MFPRTCSLIALIFAAAIAPDAGAEAAWWPLADGATWTYRTHRDVTLGGAGQRTVRRFHRGRLRERAVLDARAGRFRIERSHTEGPMDTPGATPFEERQILVLSVSGDAVRLHSVAPQDPDADVAPVRYAPPVQLLPARVRPGVQWIVGTLHNGPLAAALRGEVVGFEDLTLDGVTHAGTLRVRYRGPLQGSGELALPEGAAQIESGEYQRDLWLARGIGVVQEVTEYRLRARYLARKEGREPTAVSVESAATRRLAEYTAP